MKLLRPVLFGVIIAGAFFYFTTYRANHGTLTDWMGRPNKVEISEASSNDSLDAEEQNNISVYRKNISSVVNITSKAVTFDFFYGLVPEEGQGSGFIIDKEGHILTNYHVIADARQIEVTLHNRKKYRATIVGTDRSHDLAVVQIKAPDLTPMVLGGFATALAAAWKFLGLGSAAGVGPLDSLYALARRIRKAGTEAELSDIEEEIDAILTAQRAKSAAGDESAVDDATLNVVAHRLESLIHDRRTMLAKRPAVVPAA